MMFVDSIVLMIDTLLPLFLVQVYFAKINKVTVSSLTYVLPSLLISVSLGLFCYPFLANAFNGFGIEISKILGLIIGWGLLLYSAKTTLAQRYINLCICLISITWFTSALVELALYLKGYWDSATFFYTTILGCVVGLMIAWSVHILLELVLVNSADVWSRLLTAFFCAGLLSQSVDLLAQINIIVEYKNIHLLGSLATDDSIIGTLCNIFWGYKSTISGQYALVYIIVLIISFRFFSNPTARTETVVHVHRDKEQ